MKFKLLILRNCLCLIANALFLLPHVSNGQGSVYQTSANSPICVGAQTTFAYSGSCNNQWQVEGGGTIVSSTTTQITVYWSSPTTQAAVAARCFSNPSLTAGTGYFTVYAAVAPSVSITGPSSVCNDGSSVTYTAAPVNGGTSPWYNWKVNGVSKQNSSSKTFSTSTLQNGDVVSVQMTSNFGCLTTPYANSNSIPVTVTQPAQVSVSITVPATQFCPGQAMGAGATFTATPTNGGSSPSYNWYKNGSLVNDNELSGNQYRPHYSLNNGDVITCKLTSSLSCKPASPATSNAITITVINQTPTLSITASKTSLCPGDEVTFQAVSGFPLQSIGWRIDNSAVLGSASTFTTSSLSSNNVVYLSAAATTTCGSVPLQANTQNMLTYYPAPPSATITPSGTLKICSTCSQAISVNTGTGYLYQWTKDGSPIIGATGSTYTAQQNGTYRAIITTNICPGSPSLPLILSLNQLPLVNAGTDITITAPASQVTLNGTATDPDGTITSVKWTQVSGYRSTIASNNTLSTMITGLNRVGTYVYRLTATDDMNESAYDEVAVIVAPPSNNYNWIREQVTEVAGATTVASVTSLPIGSRTERWTYFDGIGRPMQTVQTQNSPSKTDVNEPVLYDDYGRNARKYLPVTKGATGWYKSDLLDINNAYLSNLNYTNGEGDLVKDDTKSYSETVYESSPLNRPLQDFGTGQSWRDNNKYVLHQYPVNDATIEQVIAWSVSAGLPVRSAVSNTAVSGGNYTTGQLMIKSTTDEQGNEVREYVDKEGHTILKKVEAVAGAALNSNTGWAQTYYIYDDFGLLRFVLQPELVKKLVTATTWADPTATDLGRFAFQYQYDSRNRMTSKQVPGAQPVYMVYDQRDRLILTQDGNQRAAAPYLWTFNKYDNLNRPVLTGIKDTSVSLTQAQMQAAVDAHFAKASAAWGETFVGGTATGNIHGYTNKAYPVITGSTAGEKDPNKYLSVTYYDNYAFRNDWPFTYTYTSDNLTSGSYTQVTTGSENLLVTGRPTGAKTKVLDGGVRGGYTWLRSVTYYDDKYRVIQTQADNYKGGKDVVSNLYDFSGKVLKSKETHTVTTMQNLVAVKQVGNKWINTNTTSAWGTSGFSSIQQLNAGQDGWLEFVAVETNLYRMIGLSSSDPNTNYTSINYAMNLTNTGAITVYENGTSRGSVGSYIAGDLLRIERRGTTIKYYKNNQPLPLYTSTVSSGTALMVDVANYSPNATLVNVRTSFTSGARSITHTYVYDHAQRLTEQWHQVDNGTNYRTVFNQYNEIGQLVDKKLHSTQANGSDAKQSVDYRYNIRGWLTSMNNSQLANDGITNDDATDLFGMNFLYEQSDANLASTGLFNGNISGMKWSSNLGLGDTKETGYNFTYDALNRLQHANSRMNKTSTWQAGNYHENNLQYDLNGNITALQRYGDGGNQIDNLVYNYGAAGATSNQLVYVQDNTTNAANKVKGFADGQTGTATDYTYDVNGNMTRDLNKGIGTSISDANNRITYNYLNLPEVVTKAGNTIQYMYTATGQKVAQVMTAGASIKQTDYVGAYVYENDVLQFINHEEGRVAVGSNQLIYSNSFNTTTSMTAANATLGTATGTNGETYVTVTAPATGMTVNSGVTGIGGTYAVQPGERYKVRVKGYRTAHAANLQITAGAVVASPGTALPSPNSAYESWVEQIVTIPASVTTMTIGVVWTVAPSANEILYLNELEVTKLTTNATPEYQYHLKDHLGNVRLTFTTAIAIEAQTATYEPANATTERANFVRYDNARTVNATIFDHTNGSATGYSERLSGSANEKYGLARSISVMPGDVIQAEVYAKYVDPNSSNWNSALSTLMAQIASNTAGVVVDGVSYSTSTSSFPVFSGVPAKGTDTGGPKAYLNWLVFDRNYNLLTNGSGYVQMTTVAKETGTDVTHEYLTSPSITISQPGYVYIYLSNEETAPVEVYFDDFQVTQTKSPVIQQQDYYPFGLTFNSYSRENSVANDYKYNGKEEQNELGLGWLDYGARMYIPEIGRFLKVDRLTEKFYSYSLYGYAASNPVLFVDKNGDEVWIDTGFRKLRYEDGKLYNSRGREVRTRLTSRGGGSSFLGLAVRSLNSIGKTTEGGAGLKTLQSSKNTFTISSGVNRFVPRSGENKSPLYADKMNNAKAISIMNGNEQQISGLKFDGVGSGGTIYWSPKSTEKMITETGEVQANPVSTLAHEMGHALDSNQGLLSQEIIPSPIGAKGFEERGEYRADYFMNQVSKDLGLPLRAFHSSGGPPLLSNGNPISVPPPQITNKDLIQLLDY